MSLYSYKAVAPDGRKVLGRIDALNVIDLEMRLRRMELDLISGETVSNQSLFGSGSVPRRELIHFCFHLELLVRAGVPILEGLSDLRDTLENPRFREVVASLIESIEGGQKLSQAMEGQPKIFQKVFVSLIRAGETTGQLPKVLQSLTESLKWEDELASQTKKLIMYPAFVGTVVIAATFFLMIYMVPQLKQFIKNMGQVLPMQTQVLFFVSDVLVSYWYIAVVLPILVILGVKILLHFNPLARVRLDGVKLKLPLIGDILRKIILSRFANTFALLYASGIPILESIRTTQDVVGNLVVRQALKRVEQLIGEGQNVTAAFHSIGFFPPLVIRMLRVGESTGALDAALINVSYFYNRDVKESVEKVQQLIEPMLTVVLGCLLGWIMLSVLGPVYDVISKIKT
ncbi:type II secretion system F family protein [Propionivibrio sp.]|uniref:type II secretion system F family protein n=1 Tax=Propionivibrio sp. TaxID=2212460 RepID=UPI00260146F6|nr:type II secretion system F family protein [Propionivibrio sp.]MBK8399846.1 type II secretion system F family protein [Propionivibrio sp.]MBK8743264.1 type II secretion system F family protein [Propionivibrio sp.]MBK8894721.1 type II secretion system F family protein [Propionivibrio sp.]MBL0207205.1 type II secretion system F family protein [Propionivibrio sp.]